jgi:transposase InsO family protein
MAAKLQPKRVLLNQLYVLSFQQDRGKLFAVISWDHYHQHIICLFSRTTIPFGRRRNAYNCKVLIQHLEKIFGRLTLPNIITDNGPAMVDRRTENFLSDQGIKHHLVTPFWPQANVEVER